MILSRFTFPLDFGNVALDWNYRVGKHKVWCAPNSADILSSLSTTIPCKGVHTFFHQCSGIFKDFWNKLLDVQKLQYTVWRKSFSCERFGRYSTVMDRRFFHDTKSCKNFFLCLSDVFVFIGQHLWDPSFRLFFLVQVGNNYIIYHMIVA